MYWKIEHNSQHKRFGFVFISWYLARWYNVFFLLKCWFYRHIQSHVHSNTHSKCIIYTTGVIQFLNEAKYLMYGDERKAWRTIPLTNSVQLLFYLRKKSIIFFLRCINTNCTEAWTDLIIVRTVIHVWQCTGL